MRVTRPVVTTAMFAIACAVGLTGPGWSGPIPARAFAAASARSEPASIPAPTAQGRLRIARRLRDGGTVHAAGLNWPTSPLGQRHGYRIDTGRWRLLPASRVF